MRLGPSPGVAAPTLLTALTRLNIGELDFNTRDLGSRALHELGQMRGSRSMRGTFRLTHRGNVRGMNLSLVTTCPKMADRR